MKSLYWLWFLIFLVVPVWADDGLKPESAEKAVKEYKAFWKSGDVDPMNQEVWKLYIFGRIFQKELMTSVSSGSSPGWNWTSSPSASLVLVPKSDYVTTPNSLLAGLGPKPGHFVLLQINNLYNFFRPIPKPGDVIVVEGKVLQKLKGRISYLYKEENVEAVSFYAEDGQELKDESFDPPQDETKIISSFPAATPTLTVTRTTSLSLPTKP